jgi:RecB family exonuclease
VSLRIALVHYGAAGQIALYEAIFGEKAGDLAAPVTVVAPNARAAVHLRHELARTAAAKGHGGLLNVSFTVMSRVAGALGASYLESQSLRPLDRVLLGAAIRAELSTENGVLGRLGSHRSTEDELASLYVELRDLDEAHLDLLGAPSPVARDLVRLFRGVRARLQVLSYDDDDLCETAASHARDSRERVELGSVIVYLPEQLRRTEMALLVAIGESGNAVAQIGVLGDSNVDGAGAELCDAFLARGALRQSVPGEAVSFATTIGPKQPIQHNASGRFDAIFIASDADAEVRKAVALLAERFEGGARLERLALVYTTSVPYARLCGRHLDAARLPWSGPSSDVLAAHPNARFISSLLSLVVSGVTRSGLIELCSSTVIRDAKGAPIPLREWDRCSKLAGLTDGGIASFQVSLAVLRAKVLDDLAGPDSALGGDGDSSSSTSLRRAQRARRTISGCEGLSEFLSELSATLDELGRACSWVEIARICQGALDHFVGNVDGQSSAFAGNRDGGAILIDALKALGALGALDRDDETVSAEVFAEALDVVLARPSHRIGSAGTGVIEGSLESLCGFDLDCVIVIGCVEGNMPARLIGSPLLDRADRERAGLSSVVPSAVAERDFRRLLIALGAGGERIATVPRFDSTSRRVKIASRFLRRDTDKSAALSFSEDLEAIATGKCSSPDATTRECAELLATLKRGGELVQNRLALGSADLCGGLTVVRERRMKVFGEYAGFVFDVDLPHALSDEPFSPTTLEAYATCPMRFFFSHALGCEVLEEPERRWVIDARDKGLIAHEVLERYVAGLIATDEKMRTSSLSDEARLEAIMRDVTVRYEHLGRTGKAVLWERERRRLFAAIKTECERDERRCAQSGRRPIAVEHAFGYGTIAPLEVPIGPRTLRFRGKIDRVDRASDSTLIVIDYKTGNAAPYAQMSKDPLDKGKRLQLPVYALAARAAFSEREENGPVEAVYRFVGGEDREIPFILDENSAEKFVATVSVLASCISAGCFPVHPGSSQSGGHANCRSCDFDVICPVDRGRWWERASQQEALASYTALAEGETDLDAR